MNIQQIVARLSLAALLTTATVPAAAELSDEMIESFRPVITEGLSSTDATVLVLAVRAAVHLNDSELTAAVVGQLENADHRVKTAAALALLTVGESESEARAVLSNILAEGTADARVNALERAMPLLSDADQASVLGSAIDAAADNLEALRPLYLFVAQRGRGQTYELLSRILTVPEPVAVMIRDIIIRVGREDATAVASSLIASGEPARQAMGVDVLVALNTLGARDALADALNSGDVALAQRVGSFLARYGNTDALQLVKDLAFNPAQSEADRIAAMRLLAERGPLTAAPEEIMALTEEPAVSTDFLLAAYSWLGATREPGALATLREMFDGFFADQRILALAGLGFAGEDAPVTEIAEIMTGSGEPALRLGAALALGQIGNQEAVAALSRQLFVEPVEEMKVAIIQALGNSGSSAAAQPVANEFASQNALTSMAALNALAAIGNTSISRQVESVATTSRDPAVRWRAVIVLTELQPEIGEIRLMQALSRPPEGFRDDIAHLSDELLNEVDETLLTHQDENVRSTALFRVLGREDGGYSVLRPLLEGRSSPEVRAQALAVVAGQRRVEDAELFQQLTSDPDRTTRLRALVTLAELGDPAQVPFFEDYADHADATLRLLAAWALLNIDAAE
jgi:HEAT repeat protein